MMQKCRQCKKLRSTNVAPGAPLDQLNVAGAPLGAEDCLRQVIANAPKLQVDG